MADRFDVFVSYAHRDADWVRTLAGRLHQAGFAVFLDEWELAAGDILGPGLEAGVRDAATGILVFSPEAVASAWVMQEYAALLRRAVEQGRRFIPVLHRDVRLPEFAATRLHVDFRDPGAFERKFEELTRALRGLPPGRRPDRVAR